MNSLLLMLICFRGFGVAYLFGDIIRRLFYIELSTANVLPAIDISALVIELFVVISGIRALARQKALPGYYTSVLVSI